MKSKTMNIPADLHKQLKREANEKDIKLRQYTIYKLQQETFPEALLNQFDSITSIEMAKNIAEELFERGTVRDTVNELAQNYQHNLEAKEKE